MKLLPDYAENIVVAVVYRGRWTWLVTEKEDWFLDYRRWGESFRDDGNAPPDAATERYGIEVLDETTIADYLKKASEHIAGTAELSELVPDYVDEGDIEAILPALLVDFDARRLVNSFPEPSGDFEDFVPRGWTSCFGEFLSEVPELQKYWIVDGVDYAGGRDRAPGPSPPPGSTSASRGDTLAGLVFVEGAILAFSLIMSIGAHLQGRPFLAERAARGATAAVGAMFMTLPFLSAVQSGTAGAAWVGPITRASHPKLYRITMLGMVGLGLAIVVGAFAAR